MMKYLENTEKTFRIASKKNNVLRNNFNQEGERSFP